MGWICLEGVIKQYCDRNFYDCHDLTRMSLASFKASLLSQLHRALDITKNQHPRNPPQKPHTSLHSITPLPPSHPPHTHPSTPTHHRLHTHIAATPNPLMPTPDMLTQLILPIATIRTRPNLALEHVGASLVDFSMAIEISPTFERAIASGTSGAWGAD